MNVQIFDLSFLFLLAVCLVVPTLLLHDGTSARVGYVYLIASIAVLWAACKAAPFVDGRALDSHFLAPAIVLIAVSQLLEIALAPVSLYNEAGLLGLDRRAGLAVIPTTAGCLGALAVYRLKGIFRLELISAESKICVKIEYPIVVPGNSGASTAGQSASGGHVGKLRENAHIGAFKNLVWDPLIPEFYSVPTVWSFSLLKALEKVDKVSLAKFMRLYVRCLVFHRAYWPETRRCMSAYTRKVGIARASREFLGAVLAEGVWVVRKIFSMARVTASGKAAPSLQNVADTPSASRLIEAELQRSHANSAFDRALADFPFVR